MRISEVDAFGERNRLIDELRIPGDHCGPGDEARGTVYCGGGGTCRNSWSDKLRSSELKVLFVLFTGWIGAKSLILKDFSLWITIGDISSGRDELTAIIFVCCWVSWGSFSFSSVGIVSVSSSSIMMALFKTEQHDDS